MELAKCLDIINSNKELSEKWECYRSKNPNTVGGFQKILPKFIKKHKKL